MEYKNLFSLTGKVIVVTGATGVLGEAFINGLVDMDATVVLIGRNEEVGHEREKAITDKGGHALFVKADTLVEADLVNARSVVLDKYGRVDGLVNAAGGNVAQAVVAPGSDIFNVNMDGLKQAFDLNLYGTILPVSIFGKAIAENGAGSIVNISSMAAQNAITQVLGYSMAKAAIDNYTRWMCVELANRYGDKIRMNAIAPGFFVTKQNRHLLLAKEGYTARGEAVIRNTPYGRFGQPKELVGCLIWLLSDASSFVSGEVICIDGGFHINSGV